MFPPAVPTVEPARVPPEAVLLDVRESEEWQAGHIEGAVHIPLGQLPTRLGELPPDGEIVVVCRSGARSAQAVAWLNQNGADAVNLGGGMGAWWAAGLPMVSDSGASPFVR
jgi:rhodanese-related sulfurtransferase